MSIGLQIILHLWGDYVIQNHAMANRKRTSMLWAVLHAVTYAIPFALVLLACNTSIDTVIGEVAITNHRPILIALAVIIGTHAILDRYAPHQRWMKWWGIGQPSAFFEQIGLEQPQKTAPAFLGVWLGIIVDNTLHLTINAAVLFVLGL